MSDPYWLTDELMICLKHAFSKAKPWIEDRRG